MSDAVIEDALWAAARRRLPPEVLGGPGLTQAVIDRSRRYTSERERLSTPTRPDADLAARALFFTIADAGKLPLVLAELDGGRAPVGFLAGERLRVLDLGAGCGAMTLGLITALAARGFSGALEVTLVDRDRAALAIAADAIAAVAAARRIACTVRAQAIAVEERWPPGPYELVLAGTVVNELADGAILVDAAVAALAATGVAIVIEPALRATSRALHALRDRAITGGVAAVLAPCTRRAAPCPALADDRDWCHERRPMALPPRAHQLAHVTGLRDGDGKWSFLALARPEAAPPPLADAYRVVDEPRADKGKHELTACGDAGWVRIRLLRRHRSADNRRFERLRRGELFTVPRAPTDGALELGAADPISAPATPASR